MPKHAPHPGLATMEPVFSYTCPEMGMRTGMRGNDLLRSLSRTWALFLTSAPEMPKHAPHPGFATIEPVFSYICPEMGMRRGMRGKGGVFRCGVVFYGYGYDTTSYVPIRGTFSLLSAVGARQCYGDRAEPASLWSKWNRQCNSLQHR